MHKKFLKNLVAVITVIAGVVTINMTAWLSYEMTNLSLSDEISSASAAGRSDVGVVTFVSSLPKSSAKETATEKAQDAGFSWAREEYTYSGEMNWAPYDGAYSRLRGAGFRILGLLTYPEGGSHDAWKKYVDEVVDRYPGVAAWEIMNEADNYLSAGDYTPYLKEAYDIIKSKGSATVVMTGLTARWEVYPFWDGVAGAGGWGSFDAVGLHIFHDGPPGEDSYNNGILSQEVQQVVNSINKNGGGKGIWVTEFGFDSNAYGLENQTNWMIEGLNIVSGFGEVQKIFIYRLYDRDTAHGLVTSSFGEKPVYTAVKNWMTGSSEPVAAAVIEPAPTPAPAEEEVTSTSTPVTSPKTPADKTKSSVRLDGANIAPDGKAQYRIVVQTKDADGNIMTDQKPNLLLSGGQTAATDFTLVGEEWFAYVASSELGERTAQIRAGNVDLDTVKLVFGAQTAQTSSNAATSTSPATESQTNPYLIWYIVGAVGANVLVAVFLLLLRKRYKLTTVVFGH